MKSETVPTLGKSEFNDVASFPEEDLEKRFRKFIRGTHAYLNALPCVADLQTIRKRSRQATAEVPFGTFAAMPGHWYSFNHGGRNECQFNVGLCPDYYRIGIAFEMSLRKGGNPDKVHDAYVDFVDYAQQYRTDFDSVVTEQDLEIEWGPTKTGGNGFVKNPSAAEYFLDPRDFEWLFLGRLLRYPQDEEILADENALAEVYTGVFCGLKPFWQGSQTYRRGK